MDTVFHTCHICPRNCLIDRSSGKAGFCGAPGAEVYAARAALHFWEEPCISGKEGSGTVFFSGCNMRCIYCQNHDIAGMETSKAITVERLSEIFLELQNKKANNINLVTPTHFAPQIREALLKAKERGLTIPIVYNTSGYETVEALQSMEDVIDIYLTDYKYADPVLADRFSRAPDYPERAFSAIEEMVRQQPACIFSETGLMKKGVIVRHLLLPGHVKNGKAAVERIFNTFGDAVYISLMNQYTPLRDFPEYPELSRRVTKREYQRLIDYALELGIVNAFIQEGETAEESFIPRFDYEGI